VGNGFAIGFGDSSAQWVVGVVDSLAVVHHFFELVEGVVAVVGF